LGPRALGNRSILADPKRPDMKDRVNAKIKKRESFRPFSPSVMDTEATQYFNCGPEQDLRFMIETVQTKAGAEKIIPSVVHVNGSSRVQVVHERDNPQYYALLRELKERAGHGIVLNTSFNVKDEPIVNSPEHALRTFHTANLDALIIGSYIVKRSEQHE
jgi:carbamoyltransferase